jgi:hypothetical protein
MQDNRTSGTFWIETSMRTDPAVIALTDQQFRIYITLIFFASRQPERGTIDIALLGLSQLATQVAGGNTLLLNATLHRLAAVHLITLTPSTITIDTRLVRFQDEMPEPLEAV